MIKLFRKIPLRIRPYFWLLSAFIGWVCSPTLLGMAVWMGVVLLSILVHELGHALSSLYWGQQVEIELGGLGGVTLRYGPRLNPLKEFFVIFMGPCFGLLLALTSYLLYTNFFSQTLSLTGEILYVMMFANIAWSLLNLVPVLPLDGGKLFAVILESFFGNGGLKVCYLLSTLFSFFFVLFFLKMNAIIGAVIFLLFTYENFRAFKEMKGEMSEKDKIEIENELQKAAIEWQNKQFPEATQRLEKLQNMPLKGKVHLEAVVQLATYHFLLNQFSKAHDLLFPLQKGLSKEGLRLLQLACYKLGHFQEVLLIGERGFVEDGGADFALYNAYAAAQLQKTDAACNWLKSAKRGVGSSFQEVLSSSNFDPIRNDPEFQRISYE